MAIRGAVRFPERRTDDAVNVDRSREYDSENLMTTEISDSTPPLASALIDVQEVAKLLACSTRHVYRLCDAGRMPPPMKLGALVRCPRCHFRVNRDSPRKSQEQLAPTICDKIRLHQRLHQPPTIRAKSGQFQSNRRPPRNRELASRVST